MPGLPACDAYLVMEVIHGWRDEESVAILQAMRRVAPCHGKVLVIEQLIPNDPGPHWAKMLDVHMTTPVGVGNGPSHVFSTQCQLDRLVAQEPPPAPGSVDVVTTLVEAGQHCRGWRQPPVESKVEPAKKRFFPAFRGVVQRDGVSTFYDYPGAVGTALTGINDHGEIVGAWIDADLVSHGFLLRKGVTTAIQVPGSIGTRPNGLNNRGQIVGTYFGADSVRHGFLLDSKRDVYQTLDYPNASSTVLTAINDHGVIVGTYDDFSFGLVATPEK